MNLYTIDPVWFNKETLIEEYESLVWTERFIEAGDMRLILPATPENIKLLADGTYVGLSESREIMVVESQSIEDGAITITGKTFETLFEERVPYWTRDIEPGSQTPDQIMNNAVYEMNLDNIPGLNLEIAADGGYANRHYQYGVDERLTRGTPGYTLILGLAKKYNLGIACYWTAVEYSVVGGNFTGHVLNYRTYLGVDRSNDIIFAPQFENLAGAKELHSNSEYKNYAMVAYPPMDFKYGLGENGAKISEAAGVIRIDQVPDGGFKRVLFVTPEIKEIDLSGGTDAERLASLRRIMRVKGRQALRAHKKIKMVDGEITAETPYKYRWEYNPNSDPTYRLGDKVKIGGHFTSPIKGVVTEFTRSLDNTGYRAYPTVVGIGNTLEYVDGEGVTYGDYGSNPPGGGA